MRKVSINNEIISFRDSGKGEPIIFLHGFPFDNTMWDAVYDELKDFYRVIVPDLRGFGESTTSDRITGMSDYADDVALLLNHLEIRERVIICGLSMGGYIAIQFAKHHSNRLRALVLCDTKTEADTETVAANRCQRAEKLEQTRGESMTELMAGMIPNLFSKTTRNNARETVQTAIDMMMRQQWQGVAAADRGMASRECTTDYLHLIKVPVLVICGEHDVISPISEMQKISNLVDNSVFQVIPCTGHLSTLESPKYFSEKLKNFISANKAK